MNNFYFLIILFTSFCANAQQLTSVVVINQLPNCINNTGTLEVTAIGGVPPYNYSINPNINGSGSQTSTTFPNLVPGNYIITTTDSVNDSVNVTVTLVPPPQLLLTVNNGSTILVKDMFASKAPNVVDPQIAAIIDQLQTRRSRYQ